MFVTWRYMFMCYTRKPILIWGASFSMKCILSCFNWLYSVPDSENSSNVFPVCFYLSCWTESPKQSSCCFSSRDIDTSGDLSSLVFAITEFIFRHFVLRFWNHTLTWLSDMRKVYASWALSGPAKYFVCWNVFSNRYTWRPLNVGLVFRLRSKSFSA